VLYVDALQPIISFEDALECALQYASRWLVEELHKGIKTGLGAERLRLQTGARLTAVIAMMSLVAVRLLALKELGRVRPQAGASEAGLTRLGLEVLALATERHLETVGDVLLALGRLGGHLNRRGDGLPGWMTLWRGSMRLEGMLEGVRLVNRATYGE
jgi:hypothetical protein